MKALLRLAAIAAVLMPVAAFAAPENFPDGMNNLPSTHWFAGKQALPGPFPPRWFEVFEEFSSGSAGYTEADWVLTTTEAGAGSATEAVTDEDGGTLLITNDAADNDADFYQSKGEVFTFAAGKKLYCEFRFKVSDATQSDFIFGLQVRDTTPLAVSDGVFFMKDDGDALLDFHSFSGSVDSAASGIATVTTAYAKYAFYYDGATRIQAAVNDAIVAELTQVTPPTTELTVSFGVQNGEAVAKTMSVDYLYCAKER
jgi:hypothetical protein